MVINEKALVSRMKEAYRTYGYAVCVDEDTVYLTNGFWLAAMDIDQVPSEIMGMFGEHIRDIPRSGDAYKVTKDKDGPVVQTRILEDAMGAVRQMETNRHEAFVDAVPVQMRKTNLIYDGCHAWQAETGRDIFLIDPRYAVLIEKKQKVFRVGEGIYAEDDDSQLWVLRVAKESDKAYLEHMEKISWIKE